VSGDVVEGRAILLGDDVNTDNIVPGPYLNVTDADELGRHLLETYPGDAGARIRPGDIVVAGRNFGMGSSREQAQIAMLARGVAAVIAASFARNFLRNAVNVGLPVVDRWQVAPRPPFMAEIVDAGGLVAWTRRRLQATGRA
jgi:3-isopropylmalate/(R)-2-methylmalate dehydratase small subunit